MRTMKGPGLFLAQFATDTPPHNTLAGIAKWAKDYGYKAIRSRPGHPLFDLDRAYETRPIATRSESWRTSASRSGEFSAFSDRDVRFIRPALMLGG